MSYCYLNGKIIPQAKAGVKLNDLGLLRGYGVFDFLRTYNGQPFLFKEHLIRLKNSAQILNLKLPLSQIKLKEVIKKLLTKNKFKESVIRIVVTGGSASDGLTYNPKQTTLFILVGKCHQYPTSWYLRGVKLITHEYQRQIPRVKVLNYASAIALQDKRKKAGASEILYISNGYLLEGTMSNFFIFKGDILITPRDNILFGTTRNLVIKLAQKEFKIEQRRIFKKELRSATEAFITSTTIEILPVVKIDNQLIGNGKVGKNTAYLRDLFRQYTKNY